jgi:hypothetical protein
MAINTSRVIVGGLAGGVVMNVVDFVSNNYILAGPMHDSMQKLNPTLVASPPAGATIAAFVIIDFIWMFVAIWLYAAARPRFGAGPRTASYVAIAAWILGSCVAGFFCLSGFFPASLYWESAAMELVSGLIATNVGAMLYAEGAPA